MKLRATTILTVRHNDKVAIGGDGQVTLGSSVMKGDAVKIRHLMDGRVLTGFAGGSADAFALLERFEAKLKDFPSNVPRAATELAKDWRLDRALRRLEALLIVVDAGHTLLVTGNGDVIQPTDGILGIGSGGDYAVAAARALVAHSELTAGEIVRRSGEAGQILLIADRDVDRETHTHRVLIPVGATADTVAISARLRPVMLRWNTMAPWKFSVTSGLTISLNQRSSPELWHGYSNW